MATRQNDDTGGKPAGGGGWGGLVLGLLVLAVALGARLWYLSLYPNAAHTDPGAVWQVQGRGPLDKDGRSDTDRLTAALRTGGIPAGFRAPAPLGPADGEVTAHVAPLYPVVRALVENAAESTGAVAPIAAVRYLQVALGALTALLYFGLARRAFDSTLVGLLAGLAAAVHPFWLVNSAEIADGTLATFLLALALSLGARAGTRGGAVASYLFGLALAALALTRAALLPFSVVALMWFLIRCRRVPLGWLCALLSFLGFATGVAPWVVRNLNDLGEPVPVVSTLWYHLWVGNNPAADGGPATPAMMDTLGVERRAELMTLAHKDRYERLAKPVLDEVTAEPARAVKRRLRAALQFFLGTTNLTKPDLVAPGTDSGATPPAEWARPALSWALMAVLGLGLVGWRWSYVWRDTSILFALALFWIPLAYALTHADGWHGDRLPLDGPLICLAALAVVGAIPGLGGRLLRGERRVVPDNADGGHETA